MPNNVMDTLELDIAAAVQEKADARKAFETSPYRRRPGTRPAAALPETDIPIPAFLIRKDTPMTATKAIRPKVPSVPAPAPVKRSGPSRRDFFRIPLRVAVVAGLALAFFAGTAHLSTAQAQSNCGTVKDAAQCEKMNKAMAAQADALRARLGGSVPAPVQAAKVSDRLPGATPVPEPSRPLRPQPPVMAGAVGNMPQAQPAPETAKVQDRLPIRTAAPAPEPRPEPSYKTAQLQERKAQAERRAAARAEREQARQAAEEAREARRAAWASKKAAQAKARAAQPGARIGTLTVSSGGDGANCKLPAFRGAKGLKVVGAGTYQCGAYTYDTRTEAGRGFEQEKIYTRKAGATVIKIRVPNGRN